MRVMVILKASRNSEAGVMPKQEDIEKTIRFNEEMVKAGILKGADGLKPSKFGKRVFYRPNSKQSVVDGPFAETKELVAGYWIWEVKSMDEAIAWAKKIPNTDNEEFLVELRAIAGPDDFGDAYTDEIREREERMRAQLPQ